MAKLTSQERETVTEGLLMARAAFESLSERSPAAVSGAPLLNELGVDMIVAALTSLLGAPDEPQLAWRPLFWSSAVDQYRYWI
jgi:hypothetical protein